MLHFIFWLPRCISGKELACQCRRRKRCRFDPWVGKIPWRRACPPTPVFLPGESHGQRGLADYSPWSHKKLDMTEATQHTCKHFILRTASISDEKTEMSSDQITYLGAHSQNVVDTGCGICILYFIDEDDWGLHLLCNINPYSSTAVLSVGLRDGSGIQIPLLVSCGTGQGAKVILIPKLRLFPTHGVPPPTPSFLLY